MSGQNNILGELQAKLDRRKYSQAREGDVEENIEGHDLQREYQNPDHFKGLQREQRAGTSSFTTLVDESHAVSEPSPPTTIAHSTVDVHGTAKSMESLMHSSSIAERARPLLRPQMSTGNMQPKGRQECAPQACTHQPNCYNCEQSQRKPAAPPPPVMASPAPYNTSPSLPPKSRSASLRKSNGEDSQHLERQIQQTRHSQHDWIQYPTRSVPSPTMGSTGNEEVLSDNPPPPPPPRKISTTNQYPSGMSHPEGIAATPVHPESQIDNTGWGQEQLRMVQNAPNHPVHTNSPPPPPPPPTRKISAVMQPPLEMSSVSPGISADPFHRRSQEELHLMQDASRPVAIPKMTSSGNHPIHTSSPPPPPPQRKISASMQYPHEMSTTTPHCLRVLQNASLTPQEQEAIAVLESCIEAPSQQMVPSAPVPYAHSCSGGHIREGIHRTDDGARDEQVFHGLNAGQADGELVYTNIGDRTSSGITVQSGVDTAARNAQVFHGLSDGQPDGELVYTNVGGRASSGNTAQSGVDVQRTAKTVEALLISSSSSGRSRPLFQQHFSPGNFQQKRNEADGHPQIGLPDQQPSRDMDAAKQVERPNSDPTSNTSTCRPTDAPKTYPANIERGSSSLNTSLQQVKFHVGEDSLWETNEGFRLSAPSRESMCYVNLDKPDNVDLPNKSSPYRGRSQSESAKSFDYNKAHCKTVHDFRTELRPAVHNLFTTHVSSESPYHLYEGVGTEQANEEEIVSSFTMSVLGKKWEEMSEVKSCESTISLREIQLQEALFEIVSSEAAYFLQLSTFFRLFRHSKCLHYSLSRTKLVKIFGNIDDIFMTSRGYVLILAKLWKESIILNPDEVCAFFDTCYEEVKAYKEYIKNHSDQIATLYSAKEMNEDFRNAVKEIESNAACKNMMLANYLRLPLEHIRTWIDKLKQVEEQTSGSQKFYIRMHWRKLSKVLSDGSKEEEEARNIQSITRLKQQLDFFNQKKVPGLSLEGKLIKEGEVKGMLMPKPEQPMETQTDTNGDVHLVLFQDQLLIIKHKRKKITVIDRCSRIFVTAEAKETELPKKKKETNKASNFPLALLFLNEQKIYVVSCKTSDERDEWLEAFKPFVYTESGSKLYKEYAYPTVEVIFDYTEGNQTNLNLAVGEKLLVYGEEGTVWAEGVKISSGEYGWFPLMNYTQEVEGFKKEAQKLRERYRGYKFFQ